MKRIILGALALLIAIPAVAEVKLDINGSFRLRMEITSKADLRPTTKGLRDWSDVRLRLNPSLLITEDLSIVSEVEVMEAFSGTPSVTTKHPGMNSTFFPNWAEYFFPNYFYLNYDNKVLGNFKIGRVPLRWGYGIWYSDGSPDDSDSFLGSQRRGQITGLLLVKDFGFISAGIHYSQIAENSVDEVAVDGKTNDDEKAVGFLLKKNWGEEIETGLLARRYLLKSVNNTAVTSSETDLDFYFKTNFRRLHAGFELATRTGKLGSIGGTNPPSAKGIGAYGTLGWRMGRVDAGCDVVYASGEKDSTSDKIEIFEFHEDFHFAYYVWREIGGKEDSNFDIHNKHIANAYGVKPWMTYQITDEFQLGLAVVQAYNHRDSALNSVRILGTEIDQWTKWKFHEKMYAKVGLGYLKPKMGLSQNPPTEKPGSPFFVRLALMAKF